ncbi:MAG TPA: (2Fe-2S)-binding protein [Solirubrobacteraceae bacterium]|nr:(2Fe-2S)-binding protein [Solirubrobacteraceae bacterium]
MGIELTPAPMEIELTVNGERVRERIEPRELLLDFLRERLRLTGAKRSCDVQVCGTCTVLVDGGPVSACTYLAADADGREVLTIEGFAARPEFGRFEQAFMRHAALQCGYCTPGLLLTLKRLLDAGELRDERDIRHGLDGNLCRCTGYRSILEAARELAGEPDGSSQELSRLAGEGAGAAGEVAGAAGEAAGAAGEAHA